MSGTHRCASCRPPVAAPACPHRGGSTTRRSRNGTRPWRGPRSRSPSTPTGASITRWWERARSRGSGSTTTKARSPPRAGSSTSRTGTATPSASTRPGVTPTPPRSSPPSRLRSSGSCRTRSCAAARSRRFAKSARARRSRSRTSRATSCSCSSTACSRSRSAASAWQRSAPGRSSGNERCWREEPGRRRCVRLPSARSRWRPRSSSTGLPLEEISTGHRREEHE